MKHALPVVLAVALAVMVVTALAPDIDLAVAGMFYRPEGFSGGTQAAGFVRETLRVAPFAVLAVCFGLALARRAGQWGGWAPTARALVVMSLSFAIGPGLVVNLGLKDHSHRPRPVHVTEFGGADAFRPWNSVDGACSRNCSFASGEAAAGFWTLAPALEVPGPWQGPAIGAAMTLGVATSLLRMAFGAHFLSDVTAGGLIAFGVVVGARAIARRAGFG